ncbi:MAG TPA: branched-chain amino acid ABC transporter permease [Thermodesulfobacteriota bacterium]|nr:branched-chain amino acid ABC transporter permease [Thermodesulfobacteriota bacterium]
MQWFIYILNGLYFASFIFLISLGLNIILGVMGILNLAHGSLFAFGAFTAAWMITAITNSGGASAPLLYLSLLSGALVGGFVGLLLEWSLIRPMYKRALEYQLLITFGALLFFEDVIKIIWGGEAYYASAPFDILGKIEILGNPYPLYFLFVIAITLVIGLSVRIFMFKTRVGVMLRALSLDREMAVALGIEVNKLGTLSFVLGAALAGIAGALVAPTTPVLLGFGMEPLILAFIVVVIGGLGSPTGAFIGSVIVGQIRSIGIVTFPEIELAVLFLIAAAILVVKPEGLFRGLK